MSEQKNSITDKIVDWFFNGFESGTNRMIAWVDRQLLTHILLAMSLWFVIVWLKEQHGLFHLLWLVWFWYLVIVVSGLIRIFYEE